MAALRATCNFCTMTCGICRGSMIPIRIYETLKKIMKSLLLLLLFAAIAVATGCGSTNADSKPAASVNHDTIGPITEARLGIKIYPGAAIVTSGETDEIVS